MLGTSQKRSFEHKESVKKSPAEKNVMIHFMRRKPPERSDSK